MIIRQVVHGDLAKLAEFGAEFYRVGALPGRFDPDYFARFWSESISLGRGVIVVGEVGGSVAGTIGGLLYEDPNNGDLVAQEMFWWLDPAFRGSGGVRLLDVFEDWADKVGAVRVVMTAVHGLREKALGRLYAGRGYREVETNYVRAI